MKKEDILFLCRRRKTTKEMKKHSFLKTITFIIISLLFVFAADTNVVIHADTESVISVDDSETNDKYTDSANKISETTFDMDQIQVTAQYVNPNKNKKQKHESHINIPLIAVIVVGAVITVAAIIWTRKTYL